MRRKLLGIPLRTWIFFVLIVGILVAFAAQFSDGKRFVRMLSGVSPWLLAAAGALQLCAFPLRAIAWGAVADRGGERAGFPALLRLNLAKHFADQAVPTGGVSGSALIVQGLVRRQVKRPCAMAAFVVQTVGNSAALILAELVAFALLAALRTVPTWFWVAGLAFIGVSAAIPLLIVLLALGKRPPMPAFVRRWKPVQALLDAMADADTRLLAHPVLLAKVLALNLAVTVVDAGVIWLVLASLGTPLGPAEAYVAQAVVLLARNAAFLPSAFGSFDAASIGVLSALGVGVAAAVAATLLFRAVNLWLPIVPGGWAAQRELAHR